MRAMCAHRPARPPPSVYIPAPCKEGAPALRASSISFLAIAFESGLGFVLWEQKKKKWKINQAGFASSEMNELHVSNAFFCEQ